jgi:hypothetical protein
MKMAQDKRTLAIWTILMLISIESCTAQDHVLDHSFMFMDKWGLITGYELQYITKSNSPMDSAEKEKLFFETKKIASAYGREIPLADFYFKRDSIEKKFIDDVIGQARKNQIKIKEVKIINLIIPKHIADAIILRATSFKLPQPTRIKSYEN